MLYVGLAGGAEAGGDGVGRWVGSSGDGERSSGGDCAHMGGQHVLPAIRIDE